MHQKDLTTDHIFGNDGMQLFSVPKHMATGAQKNHKYMQYRKLRTHPEARREPVGLHAQAKT
jgi:hypothetical protein